MCHRRLWRNPWIPAGILITAWHQEACSQRRGFKWLEQITVLCCEVECDSQPRGNFQVYDKGFLTFFLLVWFDLKTFNFAAFFLSVFNPPGTQSVRYSGPWRGKLAKPLTGVVLWDGVSFGTCLDQDQSTAENRDDYNKMYCLHRSEKLHMEKFGKNWSIEVKVIQGVCWKKNTLWRI